MYQDPNANFYQMGASTPQQGMIVQQPMQQPMQGTPVGYAGSTDGYGNAQMYNQYPQGFSPSYGQAQPMVVGQPMVQTMGQPMGQPMMTGYAQPAVAYPVQQPQGYVATTQVVGYTTVPPTGQTNLNGQEVAVAHGGNPNEVDKVDQTAVIVITLTCFFCGPLMFIPAFYYICKKDTNTNTKRFAWIFVGILSFVLIFFGLVFGLVFGLSSGMDDDWDSSSGNWGHGTCRDPWGNYDSWYC